MIVLIQKFLSGTSTKLLFGKHMCEEVSVVFLASIMILLSCLYFFLSNIIDSNVLCLPYFTSFPTSMISIHEYVRRRIFVHVRGCLIFPICTKIDKIWSTTFTMGNFRTLPPKQSWLSLENLALDGGYGNLDIRNFNFCLASPTMVLIRPFGKWDFPSSWIVIINSL